MPYSEENFFLGKFHSKFYTESHLKYKLFLKKFFAEHVLPFADDWEDKGHQPDLDIYKKMGERGILSCCVAPGIHLKDFVLPVGLDYKTFDYFHELITH